MDDSSELHYILPAGIFLVAVIGMLAWQVLRLLGRGGFDAVGLIRLVCSVFVLGIMCWVGFTALRMWT
jgi:cation transporter-like permease